jgi:hypothetical protein
MKILVSNRSNYPISLPIGFIGYIDKSPQVIFHTHNIQRTVNEIGITNINSMISTRERKSDTKNHQQTVDQTEEDAEFLKNFDFSFSDIGPKRLRELKESLIRNSDVYAKYKGQLGKTREKFHITLKNDAKLKRQRKTRINPKIQERVDEAIKKLIENGVIVEKTPDFANRSPESLGYLYSPIIILVKGTSVKLVVDARYLNAITDTTSYFWPLESLELLILQIHGTHFSISDVANAYNQADMDEESKKLCRIEINGRHFQYARGFYGLKALPSYFSRLIQSYFANLIQLGNAITYIDDILLMSDSEERMSEIIEEFHSILRKAGIKVDPKKTFFYKIEIKFLGHLITKKGIQPLPEKIKKLQELEKPKTLVQVQAYLGTLTFYARYIWYFHLRSHVFYQLLKSDKPFKWTEECQETFDQIRNELSETIINVAANIKKPFFIRCYTTYKGSGISLEQLDGKEFKVVTRDSKIFTPTELKMSPLKKELRTLIFGLEKYEHYVKGTTFPLTLITDPTAIISLYNYKGNIGQREYRYQTIVARHPLIYISHRPHYEPLTSDEINLHNPPIQQNSLIQHSPSSYKENAKLQRIQNLATNQLKKETTSLSHESAARKDATDTPAIHHIRTSRNQPIIPKESTVRISLPTIPLFTSNQNSRLKNLRVVKEFIKQPQRTSSIQINHVQTRAQLSQQKNISPLEDSLPSRVMTRSKSRSSEIPIPPRVIEENPHDVLHRNATLNVDLEYQLEPDEADYADIEAVPSLTEDLDHFYEMKNVNITPTIKVEKDSYTTAFPIDIATLIQQQKLDPVLAQIRNLKSNDRKTEDFDNKGTQFSHIRYYIDNLATTKLIKIGNEELLITRITRTELRKGIPDTSNPWKICIPSLMIPSIFYKTHSELFAGHGGRDRTLATIGIKFFHPHLKTWIQALMNDCITCQRNGSPMKRSHTAPIQDYSINIHEIFHTVHMDYKGPLTPSSFGFKYILVCICAHSHYIRCIPTTDKGAETTWKAFHACWIIPFGPPKNLICDQGTEFINRQFLEIVNSYGITIKPRQVYHPQSNGMVENRMRQLATYIRKNSRGKLNQWSKLTNPFAFAQNSQFSHTTAMTPHEIVFGKKARTPLLHQLDLNLNDIPITQESIDLPHTINLLNEDRKRNQNFSTAYEINRRNKLQKEKFEDHLSRALPLNEKSLVFAENRFPTTIEKASLKLKEKRIGPYKIIQFIDPVNYVCQQVGTNIINNFHRNDIIPYIPIQLIWKTLLQKANCKHIVISFKPT